MVKIKDKAPDFCLKNQNDDNVCLKDFAGNWVITYFYPKDNTSGCTIEARNFSQSVKEFEKHNAKIIGISPDSSDSHKKFEEKQQLSITLLSDSKHEVLEKYGVWKPKKLYGKEFMGVIRSTFLIDPKGNISYIWPKVKVDGHIDDVMNKLKEMQK
jgi:peroxiredoxin Q/BCP